MTMTHLISKRVVEGTRDVSRQVNSRLSPRVGAGIEAATALEEWEAEGGASAGPQQASEHDAWPLSPPERLLLERLGNALVHEWNNFPTPLQRAVFDRAATGRVPWNRLRMRRQMARFLHDRKPPGPV
jgi:hypothetical protein